MHTPLPTPDDHPTSPGLLDELVSLTGLFNPENVWKEEEMLDELDEQERTRPEPPADEQPPLPSGR